MGSVNDSAKPSAREPESFDVIDLDDDDDDESIILEDKDEQLKARILEVFRVFDQSGDNTIDASDIGNVYRCLLLNISQVQLEEIEAQLPKSAGNAVSCDLLMPRLLSMLQSNEEKLKLPSDELLEAAFHALIAADSGVTQSSVQNSKEASGGDALTKDKFVSLMTTHGEVLTESEVNEMLSHLSIRKNGIIDWRAYIRDVRLAIDERKKCEKSKDGSSRS